MSNFIGNKEIVSMYLGNNNITSFSIGNSEIWTPDEPTPPEPIPTSARYFTFDGSAITGYTGADTSIVLPRSYSLTTGDYTLPGTKCYVTGYLPETLSNFTYINSIALTDGNKVCTYNNYTDFKNYLNDFPEYSSSNIGEHVYLYYINVKKASGRGIFYDTNNIFKTPLSLCIGKVAYTFNTFTSTGSEYGIASDGSASIWSSSFFSSTYGTIKSNVYGGGSVIQTDIPIDGNDYQVTGIDSGAFKSCRTLISITMQDNIISIGSHAFQECSGLRSITIPNNVTSIGSNAFLNCTGLTSVTINNSFIGDAQFSGCRNLTTITISDSVTSIGVSAFNVCIGLTSITIPESVISIGRGAFQNCTGLERINLYTTSSSYKPTSYSLSWFYNCSSNCVIHIPSSVTNPTSAYGTYWNYYSESGKLSYVADL